MLQYVRLAHLEGAEAWARRAAKSMSLEEVVTGLSSKATLRIEDLPKPSCQEMGSQTDVAEALVHEVHVEQAKNDEKLEVVLSDAGVAHSVLSGPPEVDLHSSKTVCGWRFGRSGAALRRRSDLPGTYKALCQRCFPELREALKVELSQSARRLGEGL